MRAQQVGMAAAWKRSQPDARASSGTTSSTRYHTAGWTGSDRCTMSDKDMGGRCEAEGNSPDDLHGRRP